MSFTKGKKGLSELPMKDLLHGEFQKTCKRRCRVSLAYFGDALKKRVTFSRKAIKKLQL